jgi:ketosteroid isomerase-like protein
MTTAMILVLWLSLMAGCRQKKDNPEIHKNILANYFDGIKTQDLQKLNSLTTSDFVLFENGKIWTNDSIATIKDKFNSFTGEWKLENMKVNIDYSSGDVVYFNHGELTFNDTLKMKFDWLESATFRKVEGEWKMNFLHSTVRK